ncbi:type VII secretion protein EssA [Pseudalkalibacillus hwajinpoensis]|uniref:Type VII secretion protein EssA n=1 Tax=Guptibacillus hwajinpoensis TaxID=208199 RepID=A0A4U1MFN7_9BACL|nr:type VII secretion protein EssA [Pseudalkalibacillus hwajinpoensis]TKD69205.1 type VII secretion protein EssA [Pseudalkalibacillus hwajinpoensis]
MKRKLISLITLVFLCCHLVPVAVEANTNINELLPNEYQKNKFKKNTDFIHDTSSKEMGEISEDQKTIAFNGEKTFDPEPTINQLFLSMGAENSTIKDKAENLKLFSDTETAAFQPMVTEDTATTSSSFQLLIGILIGVFLLVLVIVLVIYNRFSTSTK